MLLRSSTRWQGAPSHGIQTIPVVVQFEEIRSHRGVSSNPKRKRGNVFGPRLRFGLRRKSSNCTTTTIRTSWLPSRESGKMEKTDFQGEAMATTQPDHDIQLTIEQRQQLADLAQKTGKPWQELLSEFLAAYRRIEPITRSANGFCQGERGAVTTSSIPKCLSREQKWLPYMQSRSRIKYFGASSKGNASTICCAVHGAVGCVVTLKCTILRRSCRSTMKQ